MMMPQNTSLNGLQTIDSKLRSDHRGSFARLFCANEMQSLLGPRKIVQINHSLTTHVGAVRGLHYQKPPFAEMKLVRCIKGAVFDVAVDLREGSPTKFQWHGEILRADKNNMMVIPEGFAHGFQVLEPESELLYLHTEYYHPEAEGGIHPNDLLVNVLWPLPVCDLSERDLKHPFLEKNAKGVVV